MMDHDGFRVPDKVFIVLAWLVTILTFGISVYFYPALPPQIPQHFGPNGQPDMFAAKSIWLVFLPVMAQVFVGILITVVYRHPQYSNLPFSLTLRFVPEPLRSTLAKLIRHLLVVTQVITALLFAYIAEGILGVSLGTISGLNGWIIYGLVAWLFLAIIVYSVWSYRLVNRTAGPDQPQG